MNIETFNNMINNSSNLKFDEKYNIIHDMNYKISENILIKLLQQIFKNNNFIVSKSIIKYEFKNLIEFIIINIHENTIKNSNDLKFYIIDELNLNINNTEYLFKKYFNYKISEFDNNFKIICFDD